METDNKIKIIFDEKNAGNSSTLKGSLTNRALF